ncbi:hypothetical protein TNCV_1889951 [Trichonephila clavipes]|nr:hypothetical protein TNCV_1889951 [Trichonephila clavipes]
MYEKENTHLKQFKGSEEPCGGLHILHFGDFNQLPPVKHAPNIRHQLIDSRDHACIKGELSEAILTQFCKSNMSHLAFFAHADVFHHGGQPVLIELSIASIPENAKEPEVICITVDHSNLQKQPNQPIHQRTHQPEMLPAWIRAPGIPAVVRCCKMCNVVVVSSTDIFLKTARLFIINMKILKSMDPRG